MRRILCCLLFSVAGLLADVTGNWSGSFDITGPDGQTKEDTAYLKLKQDGRHLTGSAGPSEDKQFDIKTGAIEGSKITLEVVMEDGGVLKFDLALEGEHIKGLVQGQMGDEKMSAKLDVTRRK